MNDPTPPSNDVTLDVLQANVALLAEKERLERERARLVELDRVRTEFLARVSHDLRTPLNSIIGFSDLLLTGDGGRLPRKSIDYLEAIHRNGHALLGLINDLLDLSGMELGRMSVRQQSVELSDLMADIRAATEPILSRSNLQVRWPTIGSLHGKRFICDRRRLLQVMTNLLDNARKFTPSGGTIAIEVDLIEQALNMRVIDSGPGIPEHLKDDLFKPLSARSVRHDGTGLGLAIVKAIVELHGGTITVGRGPNQQGCAFSITLPAPGSPP